MLLHAFSLAQIESAPLPGPSAVVCMADSTPQLAKIRDDANVVDRLNLVFNDCRDDFGLVRSATADDARQLLAFVDKHRAATPNMVFQCQVGVGRSLAAYAAVLKLLGGDPRPTLYNGTHNRKLYRTLLTVAGTPPEEDPKVSLAVRVKYSPERMQAFLLSMQHQRYDNWEVVFVTDGPNPGAHQVLEQAKEPRAKLVETEKPLGRWGHPYRQRGIEACSGELIGLSNDDNYYVPGYIEQMVNALERDKAELVLSPMLHSYWGWRAIPAGHDVGSWIARRELLQRTPWQGDDFFYDAKYLTTLRNNAGGRVTAVDRPLFIHN